MSLKAFHIFFVVVSTLCVLFFGAWGVWDYGRTGRTVNLAMGIGGFIAAAVLVRYGFWFLKKLKGVNSL